MDRLGLVCLTVMMLGLSLRGSCFGQSCWSEWQNNNNPSNTKNRTDTETTPSDNSHKQVCDGKFDVECTDNGGEGFTGTVDRSTSHYNVSCSMTSGLQCRPFADYIKNNYTCPDFSIRIGCECPKTTGTASVTKAPSNAKSTTGGNHVTLSSGIWTASVRSQPAGHQGGGNGGVAKTSYTSLYFAIAFATVFKGV